MRFCGWKERNERKENERFRITFSYEIRDIESLQNYYGRKILIGEKYKNATKKGKKGERGGKEEETESCRMGGAVKRNGGASR